MTEEPAPYQIPEAAWADSDTTITSREADLYLENQRLRDDLMQAKAFNAELLAALKSIANGEGCYGAQAHEYKQIARAAIAKAEGQEVKP